jgi:hypothetical protein
MIFYIIEQKHEKTVAEKLQKNARKSIGNKGLIKK